MKITLVFTFSPFFFTKVAETIEDLNFNMKSIKKQ